MQERHPHSHFEKLNPNQPETRSISADIGSTVIKVGRYLIIPGQLDKPTTSSLIPGSDRKISYRTQTLEYGSKKKKFRYMDTEQTNNLLSELKTAWEASFKEDQQIYKNQSLPITTLTGFTQSLAVIYKDKTVVLLDEPSLITRPTPDQMSVLSNENYWGADASKKQINSIIKLLSLKNHPQILKKLFGDDVEFKDLKFSSMLGLIKQFLKGNDSQHSFPLGDLLGFGSKVLTRDQAISMLHELGINDDQINIDESLLDDGGDIGKFYTINDFAGELKVIEKLIETNQIPRWSYFIGLSSVGKFATYLYNPKTKKMAMTNEAVSYTTQRMGANALTKLGPELFPNKENSFEPDYQYIDQILSDAADQDLKTPYLYFPDIHDENNIGTLYRIDNGRIKNIELKKIKGFNVEERKKILLAIAQGISFGLRELIMETSELNARVKGPIYIYGGLLENQRGWAKVISQCIPHHNGIYYLGITSANITTAYLAAKEINPELPPIKIESQTIPSTKFDRKKEFYNWKNAKSVIIRHQ
jgi:hypothetical protein